jgi:hypothetical protein
VADLVVALASAIVMEEALEEDSYLCAQVLVEDRALVEVQASARALALAQAI